LGDPAYDANRRGIDVTETPLPGLGVRREFGTSNGRRLGVVALRSGRTQLVIYRQDDPDTTSEVVDLETDEADTLAELLGAPRILDRLATIRDEVAELQARELRLREGSPFSGRPLGETRARSRTGASIVAVLRAGAAVVSPRPDFELRTGDVLVVVGTDHGIEGVKQILDG
jgi:TrkA domain protein